MNMTWEQKFEALQGLGKDICIRMRVPRNWYVDQTGVEVKKGGFLGGGCGNGSTPEEAVEDHWKQRTELGPEEYLVMNAYKDTRKAVKWNGFMWASVVEGKYENDPSILGR